MPSAGSIATVGSTAGVRRHDARATGRTASIATATRASANSRGIERACMGCPCYRRRSRADLERWVAWRPTPRRSPHEPERYAEHHHPGHADPRRRDRPRVRDRRPTDPGGRRRADRVGDARGRRGGLQEGAALRGPVRDDGLDHPHARRVEGPAGDARRVRREERERHAPQAVRDVRERPAGPRDAGREDAVLGTRRRPGHRAGERRGPVRGHRVHADARRRRVPEAHLREGQREDRAVRVRVRALGGTRERRVRHQGEHHEDDRGDDEARLRAGGARLPRHRVVARHHRQLRAPAGEASRAVRRDRHDEHERRHHQRPLVGADRRARVRAVREHRERDRDLRGGPRLGPEVRRARTSSTRRR